MLVRLRDTGEVVSYDEFKQLNQNTSFPDIPSSDVLNGFGGDEVLDGLQPQTGDDQYVSYVGVELINGQWFTKYVSVDYTAEELAARVDQWRQSAVVTPFQGRMALADAELLSNVEAAIAAADEKTKVAWEYALEWKRMSPMITTLGAALNLTDAEIDDLFKAASQIVA